MSETEKIKITESVQYIIDLTRIYRYVVVKIQAMTVYVPVNVWYSQLSVRPVLNKNVYQTDKSRFIKFRGQISQNVCI